MTTTDNLNPTDKLIQAAKEMLNNSTYQNVTNFREALAELDQEYHQPASKQEQQSDIPDEGKMKTKEEILQSVIFPRLHATKDIYNPIEWKRFLKAMQLYASQEVTKATKELKARVEELENVITAKNETIDELIDVLKELCELKHYKDNVGKDGIYNKRQPEAWKQANAILNRLIGYGEPSEGEDWSGGIVDNH